MVQFKRWISCILIVVIVFSSVFTDSVTATSSDLNKVLNVDSQNNEILVKYKDKTKSEDTKNSVRQKLNLKKINLKKILRDKKLELLELSDDVDINKVIQEFQKDSNVEYVQENYILTTYGIPTDPKFNEQWGLLNNGQVIEGKVGTTNIDINAYKAWDIINNSESVIVGVLDTGIDINHIDLKDNIYQNPNEIADNGIDDDNNGFIDDISGWDFSNNDNTVYDLDANEIHGTHVAGIIAALHNDVGVCGVAPNVKILPLKFINGSTGFTSDAIEAIEYAESIGVKIINCSWGSTELNPALLDVMQNSEILFTCAAGNYSSSSTVYPAGFDVANVISVAAVDNQGNLASFSNYGQTVSIAAPGVDILSSLPNDSYGYLSGTSMASPFVAGVSALVASKYGDITAQNIKSILEQNSTRIESLDGKVKTSSIIDAYKALGGINQTSNNSQQEATNIEAGNTIIQPGQTITPPESELNISHPEIIPEIELKEIGPRIPDALEITKMSEEMLDKDVLHISWNTNIETKSTLVFNQYDNKGNLIKPNLSEEQKHQNEELVIQNNDYTRSHDMMIELDKRSVVINYRINAIDEMGNEVQSSIKSLDINKIEKRDKDEQIPTSSLQGHSENICSDSGSTLVTALDISNRMSYTVSGSSIYAYCNFSDGLYTSLGSHTTYFNVKPDIDEDWYKIYISEPTQLTIKMTPNYTSDFDIYLCKASGSCISYSSSLIKGAMEVIVIDVPAGNYYLEVRPYSSYNCCYFTYRYTYYDYHYKRYFTTYKTDTTYTFYSADNGSYNLSVNYGVDPKVIQDGDENSATINDPSDKDWYSFKITEKTKVKINLNNIPANADYNMSIYNSIMNYVGGSYITGTTDENTTLILDPGTYYVKIYSGSGYSIDSMYNLVVNYYDPDEYEWNEDIGNAKLVNLNQQIYANIDNQNDQDWYKVYMDASEVLDLSLVNDNLISESIYNIEVYNSSGILLRKELSSEKSSDKLMLDINVSDYYYIKITNANSIFTTNKWYGLTINAKKKYELIQSEDWGPYIRIALKINNPSSIKNAAIVLEYNNQELTNPSSDASCIFGSLTGLKTIASKKINGYEKNKIVFYYDMEDDFASNMEDEEVIIDYISFERTAFIGNTIISICPESYIGLYDSSKLLFNNTIPYSINIGESQNNDISTFSQESSLQSYTSQQSYSNITIYNNSFNNIDELLNSDIVKNNPKLIEKLKRNYNQSSTMEKEQTYTISENQSPYIVSTFSGLNDPNSESVIRGYIRVPAGSGMKPENVKVTLTDSATKNTTSPVTRFVYPDKVGEFVFENVPEGINYTLSVESNDVWTQSPGEKPIFGSVPKDIGSVTDGETLFIQDIGYFYKFDFNGNGIYNESNEADGFFNSLLSSEGVEEGNYLYSQSTTSLSSNQSLNLDKDNDVNISDASSSISGGTWFNAADNPSEVDLNNYKAEEYNNTIPIDVDAGESGEFIISFLDKTTKGLSEDVIAAFLAPDNYYRLIRCDSESDFIITKIEYAFYLSDVMCADGNDYNGIGFKVSYLVKNNTTKNSFSLKFKLGNCTSMKHGFGKSFSKTVIVNKGVVSNTLTSNFESITVTETRDGSTFTVLSLNGGKIAISCRSSKDGAEVCFDADAVKKSVLDAIALNDYSYDYCAVKGAIDAVNKGITDGTYLGIVKNSYPYYALVYMIAQNSLSNVYIKQQYAEIASCVIGLIGVGLASYEIYSIKASIRAVASSESLTLTRTEIYPQLQEFEYEINNNVTNSQRVGSGLKVDFIKPIKCVDKNGKQFIAKEFPATGQAHGFTDIVDNYSVYAKEFVLEDGAKIYQVKGSLNGIEGRFEWILDNGKITHRMFVQGGTINGRSIIP